MFLLAACALLHPAADAGQQAESPQTFKSGVQMLEVDARVFDGNGRFVSDLAMNDFEIIEQGVRQKIQTMFLVGGAGRTTAGAATAGAATLVPRARQTWIFVFDHQHLRPNGFRRAKLGLEAFMTSRFRAGDLAGVVMNGRMVNNRISSVRQEFLAALAKVTMPGEAESRAADDAEAAAAGGEREAGDQMRAALGVNTSNEVKRAARASIEMLDELAKGLAAMPGPKTVVLLSDGFGMAEIEGTLRTAVGRMNRAGARIYAVDTRGLAGAPDDTINSLAVDTGGIAIFKISNIGTALDEIALDTNVYYVLGYQPASTKFDGKFREIEVRVRRPDVKIRARKGYLALPPSQMLLPRPVK